MKVAFCTLDGSRVDEHFGRSQRIDLYQVWPGVWDFLETRWFEDAAPREGEEHGMRTNRRVEALRDCSIIYLVQVGGPAAAQLVKYQIHPVRVSAPMDVDTILADLTSRLKSNPPPWLRKILLREQAQQEC